MERKGTSQSDGGTMSVARNLCPPGRYIVELAPKGIPRWFVRDGFRWLIPMENWRVRLAGSRIYPAVSVKARAYRIALRTWITAGGALFTHHSRLRSGHDWPLRDLLLSDIPTLSTAAVHIGGALPGGRKVTAQLMDAHGRVLGFAKYGDNAYTQASITNEARMLSILPENVGPKLISFTPFLEGTLLVQTPLPGRMRVRLRIDVAQRRFYERLIQADKLYPASEHPLIVDLYRRTTVYRSTIERLVEEMGYGEWPVAWMHGDLAPYNMRWSRAGCLALDWEHGKEAGFPYLDAAAMLIQVAKIRRLDAKAAKRVISGELNASLPAEYSKIAPVLASLSALNMLVSWYPPRKPDSYERWLREFVGTAGA